ncbi:RxLR effector protein [Phytophthora megakarya]|uniref:RxLR effector protein n=1 Tax=Phytophthora megakarya TaxID=4795 RepID=A0A225VH48_9STRA|nr:RxLR effector protein [Phytophthora megakarya]
MREGKLPKEAFNPLIGTNYGDYFFAMPGFETWVKYLNEFNQKYTDKRTTLIDSVQCHYSDETLAKALVLGK